MAKNDQLYTLNLTVVALVALVAIVGVTAIVLNGGSNAELPQLSEENAMGQVRLFPAGSGTASFLSDDDGGATKCCFGSTESGSCNTNLASRQCTNAGGVCGSSC